MWEVVRSTSTILRRSLMGLGLAACFATSVAAQNLYAPVARVDDAVVTEFEVQQRQRFLQLLNAPGATRDGALDSLIEDRLRMQAVRDAGLTLSDEELAAGLTEFAGRANLSRAEFTSALAQSGVAEETFRDFVATSLSWRNLIRARYAGRVQVTQSDIDRARGTSGASTDGIRVLISEIIIPAPPQRAAEVNAIAARIARSGSPAEFSAYARQYSATATRDNGGRLNWTPLEQLPPAIQPLILGLAPGEVTAPLPIPNAVALFQLRAIEETGKPSETYSEIDYAAYYIPGGRSEAALAQAAKVRDRVDSCDDLYGVAKGQPAEVLERHSKAPGDIPQDIALELSKLDAGETSVALTRANGQNLMLLMMCGRTVASKAEAGEDAIVSNLRQKHLEGYSQQLLAKLRANARIVRQ